MTEAGETTMEPTGGRMLLTGIAISLWATVTWLLNVTAYPSFNGFFPLARDIATTLSAVFAVAFALVAARRPRLFLRRGTLITALCCIGIGIAGMFWASVLESPILATVFACMRDLGSSLGCVFLICALVGTSVRRCATLLVCGCAGKYVWMTLL